MFGYIYKKDVAIIAVILCLCLGVGSDEKLDELLKLLPKLMK